MNAFTASSSELGSEAEQPTALVEAAWTLYVHWRKYEDVADDTLTRACATLQELLETRATKLENRCSGSTGDARHANVLPGEGAVDTEQWRGTTGPVTPDELRAISAKISERVLAKLTLADFEAIRRVANDLSRELLSEVDQLGIV